MCFECFGLNHQGAGVKVAAFFKLLKSALHHRFSDGDFFAVAGN